MSSAPEDSKKPNETTSLVMPKVYSSVDFQNLRRKPSYIYLVSANTVSPGGDGLQVK